MICSFKILNIVYKQEEKLSLLCFTEIIKYLPINSSKHLPLNFETNLHIFTTELNSAVDKIYSV